MVLSLVPLIATLDNIYEAVADAYEQYGKHIYINSLLSETIPSIPKGSAPSHIVSDLLVNMYDNFIAFHNVRISINNKKRQDIRITQTYYAMFLTTILIAAAVGVTVVGYMIFNKELSVPARTTCAIIMAFVITLTVVLCIMATLIVKRSMLISSTYAKTSFEIKQDDNAEKAGVLNLHPYIRNFLLNCKPGSLNNVFNVDRDNILKYEAYQMDQDDNKVTALVEAHLLFVKGYISAKEYQDVKESVKQELSKQTNLVPIHKWFTSSTVLPSSDTSDNWHPQILKNAIKKIDPVGQSNQLSESIAYIEKLVTKDYQSEGEIMTDTKRALIINKLQSILQSQIAITTNFKPEDTSTYVKARNIKSASDCAKACLSTNGCTASFFDPNFADGACYLNTVPKEPLHVNYIGGNVKERNDDKQAGVMTIKSTLGKSIDMISYATEEQILDASTGLAMKSTGNTNLKDNTACFIKDSSMECTGSKYMPLIENKSNNSKLQYQELLRDNNISQVDGSTKFVLRVPSTSVVSIENGNSKWDSILRDNKDVYVGACKDALCNSDPNHLMSLDPDTRDVIIKGVMVYHATNDPKVKIVLQEILDLVDNELQAKPPIASSNRTKYVDAGTFVSTLNDMSQYEFFNTFVKHLVSVRDSSNGLYTIYKYYDIVDNIARYSRSILNLVFATVIVIAALAIVYFVCQDGIFAKMFPEDIVKTSWLWASLESVKSDKTKTFDKIVDYFMMHLICICAVIIILVFIQAHKIRTDAMSSFNATVVDKNAVIMKTHSSSVLNTVHNVLIRGSVIPVSNASKIPKQGINDMYYYYQMSLALSPSKIENIDASHLDTEEIHSKLIDIIESYKRGNALLLGVNTDFPFPSFEIAFYLIVVFTVLIVFGILYIKFRPVDVLMNLRSGLRGLKNISHNKPVNGRDLINNRVHKIPLAATAKLILMIIVLTITMVLSINIIAGSQSIEFALYASDKYRSSTTN